MISWNDLQNNHWYILFDNKTKQVAVCHCLKEYSKYLDKVFIEMQTFTKSGATFYYTEEDQRFCEILSEISRDLETVMK